MLEIPISAVFNVAFKAISYFYKRLEKTVLPPKKQFEISSKNFSTRISPILIEKVIRSRSQKIYSRLKTIQVGDEYWKLPYIDLLPDGSFEVSRTIAIAENERIEESELLNWLRDVLGKRLVNNQTFTLASIRATSTGVMEIGLGQSDYFSTIASSDYFFYKLLQEYPNLPLPGYEYVYQRQSRLIKRWLALLDRIVLKNIFSDYHASIGCSVLTILNKGNDRFQYLLIENSDEKGAAAHDKHVIPSFMFQPTSDDPLSDKCEQTDLRIHVLKEFGEELLSLRDLEYAATHAVVLKALQENAVLSAIQDGIERGYVLLEQTGLSLDVFRLRPEITFVLLIMDQSLADLVDSRISPNWESKRISRYNLSDETAYHRLITSDSRSLCPPGMAALVNGRRRAMELLLNRQ